MTNRRPSLTPCIHSALCFIQSYNELSNFSQHISSEHGTVSMYLWTLCLILRLPCSSRFNGISWNLGFDLPVRRIQSAFLEEKTRSGPTGPQVHTALWSKDLQSVSSRPKVPLVGPSFISYPSSNIGGRVVIWLTIHDSWPTMCCVSVRFTIQVLSLGRWYQ